jgi:hypothetical protein
MMDRRRSQFPQFRRRLPGQKGSALVESALILSVFLFMVVAVLDFAQFLFIHQSLVESTRKAARYGIVNEFNAAAIQNIVLYDSPTINQGAQPKFNMKSSMVVVERLSPGAAEDRIQVTIRNFPFQVYTPLVSGTVHALPITTILPYEVQ